MCQRHNPGYWDSIVWWYVLHQGGKTYIWVSRCPTVIMKKEKWFTQKLMALKNNWHLLCLPSVADEFWFYLKSWEREILYLSWENHVQRMSAKFSLPLELMLPKRHYMKTTDDLLINIQINWHSSGNIYTKDSAVLLSGIIIMSVMRKRKYLFH